MFMHEDKTYDCPYCHNDPNCDGWCQRGVLQGVPVHITIELEGATIVADGAAKIEPGDTYIAKRNTGWKLLTCRFVDPNHWVMPVESAYSYDTWECAKVISIS